jgi:hypothetical protein
MENKHIEQEHEDFVNSEDFNKMIKEKIEYSDYYKFQGTAPEGFTLVPNQVIELLKDFDNWKEFKNDPNWIEEMSKKCLKILKS